MKVVVVSGGFDPVHSGHIAYFNAAKKLGDKLIVALAITDMLSSIAIPFTMMNDLISEYFWLVCDNHF